MAHQPALGRTMGAAILNQVRLLVVDDTADNRALLSRVFSNRGFETTQADSGAAALALMEQRSFDAVLLDILMPGMDGIEVLKRIRRTHSRSNLPVIMVSGKSAKMDVALALELGANDYITKPIDISNAFARVQGQLERKRAEQAVPQQA
jgi:two-component system alkaline phosphatase synthesis response regulator PhoP